ncbi:MAG: hypothetical protein KGZ92_10180 [Firmicutes bacterium]|nr:hypothetical protein [Dethiobacter sp.]MBS3889632.1 hypothetical protein [Bacillota bacterium]
MQFSPRQMTTMALVGTTAAASGYLLYLAVPIPGLKFALLSPLLSLMMALPVMIAGKRGTILATSLVLATVMGLVSLFMSAAIVIAGVLTEAAAWCLARRASSTRSMRSVAASYPTLALLVAATLSHYVTGNRLFALAWPVLIVLVVLTQLLGTLGALVAEQILLPRLFLARQRWERE